MQTFLTFSSKKYKHVPYFVVLLATSQSKTCFAFPVSDLAVSISVKFLCIALFFKNDKG